MLPAKLLYESQVFWRPAAEARAGTCTRRSARSPREGGRKEGSRGRPGGLGRKGIVGVYVMPGKSSSLIALLHRALR